MAGEDPTFVIEDGDGTITIRSHEYLDIQLNGETSSLRLASIDAVEWEARDPGDDRVTFWCSGQRWGPYEIVGGWDAMLSAIPRSFRLGW